jgi:hypothetical protein
MLSVLSLPLPDPSLVLLREEISPLLTRLKQSRLVVSDELPFPLSEDNRLTLGLGLTLV